LIPLHQTQAALAAALLVVDRRTGGVLLKGSSGTGKSELLRETECCINSVRVPLGVDSSALTGGVDLKSVLRSGQIVRKPGLINKISDLILVMEHPESVPYRRKQNYRTPVFYHRKTYP